MNVWAEVMGSVLAVAAVSVVGLLPLWRRAASSWGGLLFGFAAGALAGAACFHLLPEAYEQPGQTLRNSLLLAGGIFSMFCIDLALRLRHRHAAGIQPLVWTALASDALHNFLDGILIALSYMADPAAGAATTLYIVLHELPQELGDYSLLYGSGLSRTRAVGLNLLAATPAFAGAALALLLESAATSLKAWLLPVAAGYFLYVALAQLAPELFARRSGKQYLQAFIGVAAGLGLLALTLLGGHQH